MVNGLCAPDIWKLRPSSPTPVNNRQAVQYAEKAGRSTRQEFQRTSAIAALRMAVAA